MNEPDEKTEDPSDNPFASKVTFLSALMVICGMLAVIFSIWTALVTSSGIETSIYLLRYADGYRPAVFTIEKIVFIKGDNASKNRTHDTYWVEGDIEGKKEKFGLGKYVPGVVQNQADLGKKVSVGQKLPVLYNPDIPESLGIRVQYPERNFKQYVQRMQWEMIRETYMPWSVSICLCLFFGVIARKYRMATGFCVLSFFILLFGAIPTVLNLLTRP
jgi:hypothetical protein